MVLHPQKVWGKISLWTRSIWRVWHRRQTSLLKMKSWKSGPGLGSLTRHLAVAAKRVVAVELDAQLIPPLKSVLTPYENVEIIHGDILEENLADLFTHSGYLVVANIPYYITSAVIRYLLEPEIKPAKVILTVQEEVARRICAEPGDLSLLAISVQVYGHPVLESTLSAGAFYPAPKVDSAILNIDLYDTPRIPIEHSDKFFRLIKAGYSQKRKTLRNALSGGLGQGKETVKNLLDQAGIDPQRRAQTLSIEEWVELMQVGIDSGCL